MAFMESVWSSLEEAKKAAKAIASQRDGVLPDYRVEQFVTNLTAAVNNGLCEAEFDELKRAVSGSRSGPGGNSVVAWLWTVDKILNRIPPRKKNLALFVKFLLTHPSNLHYDPTWNGTGWWNE